jgi:predicted metal-dependent hydrolase
MKVWQRIDSQPPKPRQSYGRDATLLFQGREYPLRIERASSEAVSLHGDVLVVQTPLEHDSEQLRGLIIAWYRERAEELFSERAMECHRRMGAESLPFPSIVIRSMKSRWGSYSYRTGRMSLNLNLIKAPLSCLDYVITHELCHIKVPNHGPRFWKLVGRYVPDHVELRRQLRSCEIL